MILENEMCETTECEMTLVECIDELDISEEVLEDNVFD